MDRTLLALKRKLESAELELLRTHTLELAERIERLEAELQDTRDQLINADAIGSMWREAAMERAEEDGAAIGITKRGELLLLPTNTAHQEHA